MIFYGEGWKREEGCSSRSSVERWRGSKGGSPGCERTWPRHCPRQKEKLQWTSSPCLKKSLSWEGRRGRLRVDRDAFRAGRRGAELLSETGGRKTAVPRPHQIPGTGRAKAAEAIKRSRYRYAGTGKNAVQGSGVPLRPGQGDRSERMLRDNSHAAGEPAFCPGGAGNGCEPGDAALRATDRGCQKLSGVNRTTASVRSPTGTR